MEIRPNLGGEFGGKLVMSSADDEGLRARKVLVVHVLQIMNPSIMCLKLVANGMEK